MEKTKEINLQEIFYALLEKIWLIILCAFLIGMAVYLYTDNFVTPMYKASVTFYVNNSTSLEGENGTISSSDLATSQRLVDTYVTILQKRYDVMVKVADEVEAETGVRPNETSILGMMEASAINDTEVFSVSISHADPEMATAIANAIAKVAPGEIESVINGSSAKVVDYAREPKAPYTPNKTSNTIYGALIGALIAIIYVIIRVLMDVRVKGEEDLAQISNAPVLGVIPDFDSEEKDSYAYESAYRAAQNKGEA